MCRRGQRSDPRDARVEVFGNPFDRAALARPVTAFEDHHDAGTGKSNPLLQFDEFRLQPEQFSFVNLVRKLKRRGFLGLLFLPLLRLRRRVVG